MDIAGTDFSFPGQSNVYHGKVRDVYSVGDRMIMVATDRISAFDHKFEELIPNKGQVLNQIATHFLQATKDVAPNWLEASPDPNVSIGAKCEPVMVEIVVRGALLGYSWRTYDSGERIISGVTLPEDLSEYHIFDKPLITPTTKSENDEPITYDEIIEQNLVSKEDLDQIYDYAYKLFAKGQAMAEERGLLLADTKYEFGKRDGQIILMDEIHTPDSSRYFYKDSYDAYLSGSSTDRPAQLSKEFLREWLIEKGFSNQPGEIAPILDAEIISAISNRYIELYEKLIGEKFIPDKSEDKVARIEKNIYNWIKENQ